MLLYCKCCKCLSRNRTRSRNLADSESDKDVIPLRDGNTCRFKARSSASVFNIAVTFIAARFINDVHESQNSRDIVSVICLSRPAGRIKNKVVSIVLVTSIYEEVTTTKR